MTKPAQNICDLITRLDHNYPLNPEDAEVVITLIHGIHFNGSIRALLHGMAAGIQAYLATQDEPGQEQL